MNDTPNLRSLQERHAPENACFGCGPANEKGLRIRSFPDPESPHEDALVLRFRAEKHHEAFTGMLNGGIVGTLLDCHSNWTACMHLMRLRGLDHPPVTVTGDFHVRLLRPTPSDRELVVRAWPVESRDPKVVVEAELTCDGIVTATCRGTFVAVKREHLAGQRW